MAAVLHVLYPVLPGLDFDHDYYQTIHRAVVERDWGPCGMMSMDMTRGLARGTDSPAPYHMIAALTFPDLDSLKSALAAGEAVRADIPNFFAGQPVMQIGEAI